MSGKDVRVGRMEGLQTVQSRGRVAALAHDRQGWRSRRNSEHNAWILFCNIFVSFCDISNGSPCILTWISVILLGWYMHRLYSTLWCVLVLSVSSSEKENIPKRQNKQVNLNSVIGKFYFSFIIVNLKQIRVFESHFVVEQPILIPKMFKLVILRTEVTERNLKI
jgi:hypothetical protein